MSNKATKVVALFLLFALWQWGAIALDKAFLPGPLPTFQAFFQLIQEGVLLDAFLLSSGRILIAIGLALGLATPLGVLMALHPRINQVLSPFISVLYPLPKVVFLPILVVLFGLGNLPKIILIALIVFFQILVVVRDAVFQIPQEQFAAMASLSDRPWDRFRHVVFPAILPDLLTALRISVGTGIAVLFFAETFASFDGLGYLILDGMESRSYPDMYAAIVGMSLLGLALYGLLAWLENTFCRWRG